MNILDKHYPEISVKTDAEDLKVIIDFINDFAVKLSEDHSNLRVKAALSLLKEIRDKMVIKEYQKRGVKKQFLLKFKAYQIAALLETFTFNAEINKNKIFEMNCIGQYAAKFHQILTGL